MAGVDSMTRDGRKIMKKHSQSILVIDDDDDIRYAIKRIIGGCGHQVDEAESGTEALKKLSDNQDIDIVFCDLRFPGDMPGEQILELILEKHPGTKVVLMSCAMDSNLRSKLLNKGASYCVQKPFFKDKCQDIIMGISEQQQKAA